MQPSPENCRNRRRIPAIAHRCFILLNSLFLATSTFCSTGSCQVLDYCSSATDCARGLYCGSCPATGKNQPICIRGQATSPTETINDLPFNRYSWLVTHNSFSIEGTPYVGNVQRITFYNQEDTVTNQLLNGVRGLMLDMYDFEGDIWLCHSFHGQCYNFTAFKPAIDILIEVEGFLAQNPSEIITIIIEDYVHTPKGLIKLFKRAKLDKYLFPVVRMPGNGEDWPTVMYMVEKNYRLLVFTSEDSKEKTEGIAYQWRYIKENEPGNDGIVQNSCQNRKESMALTSKGASLFLQNFFPTIPDKDEACKEHSSPLLQTINTCYQAARAMPNFLAVNYYMRSDGGGVFYALDMMNGYKVCGCDTIAACQAGAAFGSCNNSVAPINPPPAFGYVQLSRSTTRFPLQKVPISFLMSLLYSLGHLLIVYGLMASKWL